MLCIGTSNELPRNLMMWMRITQANAMLTDLMSTRRRKSAGTKAPLIIRILGTDIGTAIR